MDFTYDIVIIGGGPAGASLARICGEKVKTALIDLKGDDEFSFKKLCGGLLSEDAQKSLAEEGLCLPLSVLADPQIFSVNTIDLESKISRTYPRQYVNMDRHAFDLWLLSLVPESVDCVRGKVLSTVREGNGFVIEYSPIPSGKERKKDEVNERSFAAETSQRIKIRSRYIVGADGANSIVRRSFFPELKIRHYTAIHQRFQKQPRGDELSCIFDRVSSDCCSWTISKNGILTYGGAFPVKNSRKLFELQKKRLEEYYSVKLGEAIDTNACMVLRPASLKEPCSAAEGVFLIGEAGGYISPSSMEGISFAIDTARALGDILNSSFDDAERKYRKASGKFRRKIAARLMKEPFMYKPFLRKLVMRSGLTSHRLRSSS